MDDWIMYDSDLVFEPGTSLASHDERRKRGLLIYDHEAMVEPGLKLKELMDRCFLNENSMCLNALKVRDKLINDGWLRANDAIGSVGNIDILKKCLAGKRRPGYYMLVIWFMVLNYRWHTLEARLMVEAQTGFKLPDGKFSLVEAETRIMECWGYPNADSIHDSYTWLYYDRQTRPAIIVKTPSRSDDYPDPIKSPEERLPAPPKKKDAHDTDAVSDEVIDQAKILYFSQEKKEEERQ